MRPDKPWMETSARLTDLLDSSYRAHKASEPRRTYLGASMMGAECARAVAYQYHGTPKDPEREFSGRLYRIFDMGHDGEARMAQYLRIAGFDLRSQRADGSQYGYSVVGGKMAGHIDGVIVAGPDIGCPWPALWENKTVNAKGYAAWQKQGIEKFKPVYFYQAQTYMAYLKLPRALVTYSNKDTAEVACEIVEFDAGKAQWASDRGLKVVTSSTPEEFPRIAAECTDHRCRMCDYAARCWKSTPAMPAINSEPAPSWLFTGGEGK
jgi:hypothetical protein